MLYLTYCSFYSQETSCLTCHTASLMRKWAWFEGNVGVIKKIARASCAVIFWPLQPYTCSYAYAVVNLTMESASVRVSTVDHSRSTVC